MALTWALAGSDAAAVDQDKIFESMIDTELASYDDVENYMMKSETMGMSMVMYFERARSLDHKGKTVHVMRNVSSAELQQRQADDSGIGGMTSEQMREAADVLDQQAPLMEQGMQQEIAKSGWGSGGAGLLTNMAMNPPEDQPWLSANPGDMMGMYATFLRAGADAKEQMAAEAEAAKSRDPVAEFASLKTQSRFAGTQKIDGRRAAVLVADNMTWEQAAGKDDVEWTKATVWVDMEKFVSLKLVMEGVMHADGESRPVTMEKEDRDYRYVPGCGKLYKPHHSVMRLGGMLTPEQQAEMQEAQEQLADLDRQLAEMPESQRSMIMQQMGPQLEMMKSMASSGAMEIETKIVDLQCNQGPGMALEAMMAAATENMGAGGGIGKMMSSQMREQMTSSSMRDQVLSGATGVPINTQGRAGSRTVMPAASDNSKLVQIIQGHLVSLGYDPGNVTGELSKATVVAISRYQAENGLEVTGQPTPQLAGIMAAAADAKN